MFTGVMIRGDANVIRFNSISGVAGAALGFGGEEDEFHTYGVFNQVGGNAKVRIMVPAFHACFVRIPLMSFGRASGGTCFCLFNASVMYMLHLRVTSRALQKLAQNWAV